MFLVFFGYVAIPSSIICDTLLKKLTRFFAFKHCLSSILKTAVSRSKCSSKALEIVNMSAKISRQSRRSNSSTQRSILSHWKVSGAFVKPKQFGCTQRVQYNVQKSLFSMSFSIHSTCQYELVNSKTLT